MRQPWPEVSKEVKEKASVDSYVDDYSNSMVRFVLAKRHGVNSVQSGFTKGIIFVFQWRQLLRSKAIWRHLEFISIRGPELLVLIVKEVR